MPTHAETHGRDQRIHACVSLIAEDGWLEGKTARELAEKWGCSYGTVRNYRAEALRILRLNLAEGLDDERNRIIIRLEHCYRVAMGRVVERAVYNAKKGEVEVVPTKDPDVKAAVTALRQTEHILNLRMDRSKDADADDDAKLSDADLLEKINAARDTIVARLEAGRVGQNGKATH